MVQSSVLIFGSLRPQNELMAEPLILLFLDDVYDNVEHVVVGRSVVCHMRQMALGTSEERRIAAAVLQALGIACHAISPFTEL